MCKSPARKSVASKKTTSEMILEADQNTGKISVTLTVDENSRFWMDKKPDFGIDDGGSGEKMQIHLQLFILPTF